MFAGCHGIVYTWPSWICIPKPWEKVGVSHLQTEKPRPGNLKKTLMLVRIIVLWNMYISGPIIRGNIGLLWQNLEIIGRIKKLFSCIQGTRPKEEWESRHQQRTQLWELTALSPWLCQGCDPLPRVHLSVLTLSSENWTGPVIYGQVGSAEASLPQVSLLEW